MGSIMCIIKAKIILSKIFTSFIKVSKLVNKHGKEIMCKQKNARVKRES